MRLTLIPVIALALAALTAVAFGMFAPRALLIGWLTISAPAVAAALGAAMLVCMLKLGRSRLLDAWNAPLSASLRWLYVAPVLYLPIVVGAGTVYGWNVDAAFQDQRAYLNEPFFVVRALVYFAAFIGVAVALPVTARPGRLAALLLIAFVAANMIGIDTIMALTPEWHSSDFGLRCSVNGLLVAASVAVAWQSVRRSGTSDDELRARIDGATLLFALELGWLYLMFVDYVTAWSGNLPDEVIWYGPRTQGAWGFLIVAVVTAHIVAAALLLSRMTKRSAAAMFWIAALTVATQIVEAIWTTIPGTGVDTRVAVGASLLSIVVLTGGAFAWRNLSPRLSTRTAHG